MERTREAGIMRNLLWVVSIDVTALLTSRHPLLRWFRVIIERTGNKLAGGSNVEAHSLL